MESRMELKKTITVIQFPDEMKRKLHTAKVEKAEREKKHTKLNANNESNRI